MISGVEPPESLIFVSGVGVEDSNAVRRKVASLALRQPGFNAFGDDRECYDGITR